jgi:hypothetical protein
VLEPFVENCLDFMVEDIEKLDWAKEVLRVARSLVKFSTK